MNKAIRIAKKKHLDSADVYQAKAIKDDNGTTLVDDDDLKQRWRNYFKHLMNVENDRIQREIPQNEQNFIAEVSRMDVERALKKMKKGKAVGPDEIPVEVWKCLGAEGTKWLTKLFNQILTSEEMPAEWRASTLIPIFKNKGDIQECKNYRGIKLMYREV